MSDERKAVVTVHNPKLRESNKKKIERVLWGSKEMKNLKESCRRLGSRIGLNNFDVFNKDQFKVREHNFSWNKLEQRFMEADTASGFQQFLRAGIITLASDSYMGVETTYEDWVRVVPSKLRDEPYAPNHGIGFPSEVGSSSGYAEVGAAALDLQLRNKKYGSIYAVEQDLLEDDTTGTFQQQAGLLGKYLKMLSEVVVYAKLASVANMKYLQLRVPESETKPSAETAAYPWISDAAGKFDGGGVNRPDAFGALTQGNIQDGFIGLGQQKNLQGVELGVNPDRILISPFYQFDLGVLLNSAYYPSGAAAAGVVGGAFSQNQLKGIAVPSITRFMFDQTGATAKNSKAWYLIDSNADWFVLQLREAISVIQEAPNSGESFEKDVNRYKARTRLNADHIDPRFAWQGSDGSV